MPVIVLTLAPLRLLLRWVARRRRWPNTSTSCETSLASPDASARSAAPRPAGRRARPLSLLRPAARPSHPRPSPPPRPGSAAAPQSRGRRPRARARRPRLRATRLPWPRPGRASTRRPLPLRLAPPPQRRPLPRGGVARARSSPSVGPVRRAIFVATCLGTAKAPSCGRHPFGRTPGRAPSCTSRRTAAFLARAGSRMVVAGVAA